MFENEPSTMQEGRASSGVSLASLAESARANVSLCAFWTGGVMIGGVVGVGVGKRKGVDSMTTLSGGSLLLMDVEGDFRHEGPMIIMNPMDTKLSSSNRMVVF